MATLALLDRTTEQLLEGIQKVFTQACLMV